MYRAIFYRRAPGLHPGAMIQGIDDVVAHHGPRRERWLQAYFDLAIEIEDGATGGTVESHVPGIGWVIDDEPESAEDVALVNEAFPMMER